MITNRLVIIILTEQMLREKKTGQTKNPFALLIALHR